MILPVQKIIAEIEAIRDQWKTAAEEAEKTRSAVIAEILRTAGELFGEDPKDASRQFDLAFFRLDIAEEIRAGAKESCRRAEEDGEKILEKIRKGLAFSDPQTPEDTQTRFDLLESAAEAYIELAKVVGGSVTISYYRRIMALILRRENIDK